MSIALSGTPTGFGTANNTTDTSVTASCPSTTPGDLILAWLCGAVTGTTTFTPPAGWTQISSTAVDTGSPTLTGALWYRIVQSGDTASPVWTFSPGSNVTGVMVAYSGVDQTTPINAGSVDVNPNTGTAKTTPTITTTVDGWVVSFNGDRNGGAITGNTDTFRVQSVHSASTATWVQDSNGDVTQGSQVRTWTGPSTAIGAMAIVGLKPATTGVPVQAATGTGAAARVGAYSGPVGNFFAQMWAGVKTYIAHRLGSVSLVEHTMAACLTLIDLKVAAMEISMWMTTDGVWLASHDRTTDRMFGTTGGNTSCDIPTSTYAQVLAATPNGTITGGYPIAKVTDLLDVIPATTVVFVDNKRGTDIAAFLAMLGTYANASNRFIVKTYYDGYLGVAPAARALGFKLWGYYYDTDTAQLPTTADAFDVYGMNYNAAGAAWTAVKAYGVTIGHVTLTNANQATAFAAGADGVMTGLVYNGLPNAPVASATGTGAAADGNVTPQAEAATGTGAGADGNVIPQAVAATGTGSAGDGVATIGEVEGMYASVAKLKAQLGIPADDTTRDSMLQDVLLAVSTQINLATDRPRGFSLATGIPTTRTFRAGDGTVTSDADGSVLAVDDIGSTSGLVVQYGTTSGGWTTVAAADVELAPVGAIDDGWPATGLLLFGRSWPSGYGTRIRVTADWGWPAGAIATIDQAALIQGARVFKRKDSPEGVLGSAEWGSVRVSRVDPDVEAMLQPFRAHIALVG